MLPSTGLFKELPCPYFENGASCRRPYCHFKHLVRKDESAGARIAAVVPQYKPAPKLLTLPQLTSFSLKPSRPRLEYQPEKPSLNASPAKRRFARPEDTETPIYIPASTSLVATSNGLGNETDTVLDVSECEAEFEELSGIIAEHILEESSKENECVIGGEEPTVNANVKISSPPAITKPVESKRRDSTTSSASSTRHKHKHKSSVKIKREESSSKERKTSDYEKKKDKDSAEKRRDREKERHKHGEKVREKHTSKASSSSKHKSSSSRSSEHKKESSRSSSRHKSSSTSSSKERSHHQHTNTRPSSSSSRSKSMTSAARSDSPSKPKSSQSTESKIRVVATEDNFPLDDETVAVFATTEEDIMKECEMIYEQLEEEFAALHKNDANHQNSEEASSSVASKRKLSADVDDEAQAAAMHKKRVAYENAEKSKREAPIIAHKPNHVRNAMQAIFQRQADLRRKQEEAAAAAETALREAEAKVLEANEALRKAKEKNMTPLIPKSYLAAPRISRPIAPVANMLAFERAKKKVEELRAGKMVAAFTPAQTARGVARVAHTATAATIAKMPDQVTPKPPVLEANSTKISFNLRMQHYELMVKHCLAIYPDVPDAWQRAQTEELTVLKKCNTPVIYKSSALLAINKLRKEAADSGNKPADNTRLVSHEVILAGKLANTTTWSVQKKMKTSATVGSGEPFDQLPGSKAYDMVYELRLNEEQLVANGFPRAGARTGNAVMTTWRPMRKPNATERYCSRCGKVFNMDIYEQVCVDQCNYHPKSTGYRRGFADNQHRCCQQPAGTPGCTYANYHVTDYVDTDNLTGYVTTIAKADDYVSTKKDIYALDCEMCYTTHGIELTRVTVVDINSRTVYDALVKPDNKIVDYNTVYSGITEQMMASETRSLRDVQAILMSMFHAQTVLVGHSLESDLKALKLIHSVVVDTSVLFPHKMGPPKKRALKTLCIENLKRIIQENEGGHDSAEDAEVCIQLVKFYLRNKIS